MEESLIWLIVANIVVWVGLGLYVIFIGLQQSAMHKRLRQWEMLRNDKE